MQKVGKRGLVKNKKGTRASTLTINDKILPKSKRSQVTIFIIIAIIIIALAVLFYFLLPQIETTTGFDEQNPAAFIQACIKDKINDAVETVSLQGGSINPEHYFTYNNVNIEYLCYTNENYKTCVVQQPLLKQHIESEIKDEIQPDVVNCFNALKDSYERRNYNVQMEPGVTTVELLPKRVVTNFNYILTVSKGGTKRYDSFSAVLNNNLYELVAIANSIIEWETILGKADPRTYMTYYPDLKVELNLRDDGTRIYVLTDRNTGNKFQFASRSLVFPPGF